MAAVTIFGTGNMANGIGGVFAKAGADVSYISHGEVATAPIEGEIVVLAVPYPAVAEIVSARGEQLAGRTVIDITNPLDFETFDSLVVPASSSAAAEIQKALPNSAVLKAFNTNFAATLASGTVGELPTTVLVAGDDDAAKSAVVDLVVKGGLQGIDAGSLKRARELSSRDGPRRRPRPSRARYRRSMSTTPEVPWLDAEEDRAWRAVWKLMTWLPTRLDAQLRAEAGMSLTEYNALSQISEAPERTLRLSELGQIANMTLSHLSRVITKMEEAGWVRRFPDPTDGRVTLARLTDAGWEKVVATAPGHVAAVRRYVLDGFAPQEVTALGDAAGVIADRVTPDTLR